MIKKSKSAGSHREDNPLKTARAPGEVRRKPARVANPSRDRMGEEENTQAVKLKDKMLPGMSSKSRAEHSRTAEIQKATPLKTKID
jgi:hypothetical protein